MEKTSWAINSRRLLSCTVMFEYAVIRKGWFRKTGWAWKWSQIRKYRSALARCWCQGIINWGPNLFRFGYILLRPHTELSLHKNHATMRIQMYNKGVHSALCLFWRSLPSFPRQDVQMCRWLVANQGNQHYTPSSPQAFSSMATALSTGAWRKAGGASIAGIQVMWGSWAHPKSSCYSPGPGSLINANSIWQLTSACSPTPSWLVVHWGKNN